MGFDMFWAYLVFPISGVLIILYALRKLIEINYYPDTLDRDYSRRFQAYEEEQRVKSENQRTDRGKED
jgi:TRAP-type C4-dicarboxylate transport system permease small subunit